MEADTIAPNLKDDLVHGRQVLRGRVRLHAVVLGKREQRAGARMAGLCWEMNVHDGEERQRQLRTKTADGGGLQPAPIKLPSDQPAWLTSTAQGANSVSANGHRRSQAG